MAEEVVFEVLPGFFRRIAFWGSGGNSNQGDIVGDMQGLGAVPAGAIGDHGGVDLWGYLGAEVQLHHGAVGARQNQADGTVAGRAESTEDIGIFVTPIDRHWR